MSARFVRLLWIYTIFGWKISLAFPAPILYKHYSHGWKKFNLRKLTQMQIKFPLSCWIKRSISQPRPSTPRDQSDLHVEYTNCRIVLYTLHPNNCTRKWINGIVNVSPLYNAVTQNKNIRIDRLLTGRQFRSKTRPYRIRLKTVNKETILFSNYSRHKEHSEKLCHLVIYNE